MRIGIDLMGSECSPLILFNAVLEAAKNLTEVESLVVFASQEIINSLISEKEKKLTQSEMDRVVLHPISDIITMDDDPLTAIRHKKGSSLVIGIRLLKKAQIDAFISSGNTGALMACATLSLPLLPGIQRPALLTVLPTKKEGIVVLDVGSNIACKARHLVQFAFLGAAYQSALKDSHSLPQVGLLNIGAESKKGTVELRQAYQDLEAYSQEKIHGNTLPFKFVGNIEGRDLFEGKVNVLVTDGFTGNVLLKTSEGVGLFILEYLVQMNQTHPSKELFNSIQELQKKFNYSEYPGATLCGVDGLVIKCHGDSSSKAFYTAIMGCVRSIRNGFMKKFKDHWEKSQQFLSP